VLGKYLLKSKIASPLSGQPLICVSAFRGDRMKPVLEFVYDCPVAPSAADDAAARATSPIRIRLMPVLADLAPFRYPFPYPPASILMQQSSNNSNSNNASNNASPSVSISVSSVNAIEEKELRNAIAEDAFLIEHSQLVRTFLEVSARENGNYLKGLTLLKV
jgi:hypothetical protein